MRIKQEKIDTKKFCALPEAQLVIQLMWAANDLEMGVYMQQQIVPTLAALHPSLVGGPKNYLFRLLMSHAWEALDVLERIRKTTNVQDFLKTSRHASEAYTRLEPYLRNGAKYDFTRKLAHIRGSLTFHYDEEGKDIKKALRSIAAETDVVTDLIFPTSEEAPARLRIADYVMSTILQDGVFKPQDPDNAEDAVATAAELSLIRNNFMIVADALIHTWLADCITETVEVDLPSKHQSGQDPNIR